MSHQHGHEHHEKHHQPAPPVHPPPPPHPVGYQGYFHDQEQHHHHTPPPHAHRESSGCLSCIQGWQVSFLLINILLLLFIVGSEIFLLITSIFNLIFGWW